MNATTRRLLAPGAVMGLALTTVLGAGAAMADEAQETIIREDFQNGIDDWVWEGPPGSIIEHDEQGLLIDPRPAEYRQGGIEGVNFWHRTPIEGDFEVIFDLEPIAPRPGDGEKCNLLFMLCAKYQHPDLDVIAMAQQRTGHYGWLHARDNAVRAYEEATGLQIPPMDNYTITYYRMNPEHETDDYMMVVRRNPGFHLVKRVDQTMEDQWAFRHTVRIVKQGPKLQLFQNDRLALEAEDDGQHGPVLSGGHIGFRTWLAAVRVYSVTVRALEQAE
jgi:hypothetical protein